MPVQGRRAWRAMCASLDLYQFPRRCHRSVLYTRSGLASIGSLPGADGAPGSSGAFREIKMKKLWITSSASALLIAGFMAASTEPASAVIYCTYVGYPSGCIARAGVVLRPRPVARGGGDPRHTHEPWRPGQSRRPALTTHLSAKAATVGRADRRQAALTGEANVTPTVPCPRLYCSGYGVSSQLSGADDADAFSSCPRGGSSASASASRS